MRTFTVPAKNKEDRTQDIVSITMNHIHKFAEIGHVLGEVVEGVFVPDMTTIKYEQVDFEKLVAANPDWAPNKPKNNFRTDDLFTLLDMKHTKEKEDKNEKK